MRNQRPTTGDGRIKALSTKKIFMLIFGAMSINFLISLRIQSSEVLQRVNLGHPLASVLTSTMIQRSSEEETSEAAKAMSSILQDPERQPILKILKQGGYNFNDNRIFTSDVWQSLPKWSDILHLYGEPRILGLETCQRYREKVSDPSMREIGVAGMFNSGTNLLHHLLMVNCINPVAKEGLGIRWQVPWGKHLPVSQRSVRIAEKMKDKNYTFFLPVVSVRDPYTWMQSMCRQSYSVQFDHSPDLDKSLCPNIVPYEEDIKAHPRYKKFKYIPAHAKYDKGLRITYSSIAHLWNEWYNAYANVTDFPRLIVRMEDLVFRAENVVPKICECFGGKWNHASQNDIDHHSKTANRNSGIDIGLGSGLLRSVIRYGNKASRRKHYQSIQMEAARKVLNPELMALFGYSYEDLEDFNITRK